MPSGLPEAYVYVQTWAYAALKLCAYWRVWTGRRPVAVERWITRHGVRFL